VGKTPDKDEVNGPIPLPPTRMEATASGEGRSLRPPPRRAPQSPVYVLLQAEGKLAYTRRKAADKKVKEKNAKIY